MERAAQPVTVAPSLHDGRPRAQETQPTRVKSHGCDKLHHYSCCKNILWALTAQLLWRTWLQAFKLETMPARTAGAALPGGLRTLQSCQEQMPQLKGRREKEGMMGFGNPRQQAL